MGIAKLAQDFADTAKDMASNKKFMEYAGQFIEDLKLTDASQEALDAARSTIIKRTGFFTYLTDNMVDEAVKKSGKTKEELTEGIAKIKKARKSQNYAEAEAAALELDAKNGNSAFKDMILRSKDKHRDTSELFKKHDFVPPDGFPQNETRKALFANKPENKIDSTIHRFVQRGSETDDKITNGLYIANGMKNYLKNEDPAVNRHRLEALGIGYFGISNGIRIAKGGSPFKNEYGETDIAGVPFF